jgi:hypothetical protein
MKYTMLITKLYVYGDAHHLLLICPANDVTWSVYVGTQAVVTAPTCTTVVYHVPLSYQSEFYPKIWNNASDLFSFYHVLEMMQHVHTSHFPG